MADNNHDDLLTLSEAATISGLSAATLRSYILGRRGTEDRPPKPPVLTGVKRGSRLLMVRRADLDAYLAGRTRRVYGASDEEDDTGNLTIRDVARLMGVTRQRVHQIIARGDLRVAVDSHDGRRVDIARADVDAYMAGRTWRAGRIKRPDRAKPSPVPAETSADSGT